MGNASQSRANKNNQISLSYYLIIKELLIIITTNASEKQMQQALLLLNQMYDDNIEFKTLNPKGNRFSFTLTVKDSKGQGARLSTPRYLGDNANGQQRRIKAACWHVHGDFFDLLFQDCPDAVIRSQRKKITKEEGNWQDWNIGSQMYPFYYSEACMCQ